MLRALAEVWMATGDLHNKTIVLRADATAQRGIGHVMRCLALAEAIADAGGKPILASVDLPDAMTHLYVQRGLTVLDLPANVEHQLGALRKLDAGWLIVDSYDIAGSERVQLAKTAASFAMVDDFCNNGPYEADLVINPNPFAEAGSYRCPSVAGAEYILLRKAIIAAKTERKCRKDIRNILISCGGSDPSNAAEAALAALETMPHHTLNVRVISGPLASAQQPHTSGQHDIEIVPATPAIQDHLNWADMAILAAGTTQWEAAYLGCPFIALIIADNQAPGALAFAQAGASQALDWRQTQSISALKALIEKLQSDGNERQSQSLKAQALIDGKGAERIVTLLA